ncbi:tyrosine-type recombinase/integrase, partial [Agrobacterium sp. S2]|nr:tyrosine-type recombinase/integrase [Agrobacterium sp. S2]
MSEAVDRFIKIRSAELARQTRINDRALLNRPVRTTRDPQLHQLTRQDMESHFLALAEQKPSSWNEERPRLRTFFEWCTRYGWIDSDLLADIRPKRVIREQRLRLSPDQLLRLLEVPDPRDRAFIALAENTALRASSITSLKVGDLHLPQGYLHVVR